jgi:hypothetical protein
MQKYIRDQRRCDVIHMVIKAVNLEHRSCTPTIQSKFQLIQCGQQLDHHHSIRISLDNGSIVHFCPHWINNCITIQPSF